MNKNLMPVRAQHPRLARILSIAGALVLAASLFSATKEQEYTLVFVQKAQIGLVVFSLVFALRTFKIKTQAEFDRWAGAIIAACNSWTLASGWQTGFDVGSTIALFLIVNISFYLIPNRKLVGSYALLMAAAVTCVAFTMPAPSVTPFLLVSTTYFYLLIGLVSMRKILHDRDRLEKSEEVLRKSRDKAEEAVSTRNEFMTNMSHELRTPLNGIIGMTGLLERSQLEESQKEMVGTIEMSGQLLLSLINGILDYAKLEANGITINNQENNIENCCAQCVELVMPLALEKGLGLYLDIEPGTPKKLSFDTIKVSQILVNLLNNALKFTDQGQVKLDVKVELSDDGLALLTCQVTDTGVGIPDKQKHLIFDEFSQGDLSPTRRFGGTGLGLTICSRLLEAMGGSIEVDSTVGEGSVFTAKIPVDVANNRTNKNTECLTGKSCLIVLHKTTQTDILVKNLTSWDVESYQVANTDLMLEHLHTLNKETLPYFIICELAPSSSTLAELKILLTKLYEEKPYSLMILSNPKNQDYNIDSSLELVNPIRISTLKLAMTQSLLGEQVPQSPAQKIMDRPASTIQSRLKILVAEDNQINQKVAFALLKKLGYEADLAVNGIEALEKSMTGEYDVILMDVQMPEMDGLTATTKIRELSGPQPVIIAMTANAFEQDKENCISAGMDSFIAKPINFEELQVSLKNLE